METLSDDGVRVAVRDVYGKIARSDETGCGCGCGDDPEDGGTLEERTLGLGYSREDVTAAPEGANMGLGCGNPKAIASLKPGETVLDLGSGGGFDCFLAAKAVGESGRVINVDMTADMVSKARANAEKGGFGNVEFRLGEIESLPVADNAVDVLISNCVINLSPEKGRVFKEAHRVLKPGGRLAVADIVATATLPDEVRKDMALYAGCVAGAQEIDELRSTLEEAGFTDIRIEPVDESRELVREWSEGRGIEDFILSASIHAIKP